LLVKNKKVTDSKEINDCFSNYFSTVKKQLSNNLAHSASGFKNYLPTASKQCMFCSLTTNSKIKKNYFLNVFEKFFEKLMHSYALCL